MIDRDLHELVREIFPGATASFRRLLDGAVENAPLLAVDYLTIRDLVELSEYEDRESLMVLVLTLLLALQEGSLCISATPEGLGRRLDGLVSANEAGTWARQILADIEQSDRLIGRQPDDHRPVILYQHLKPAPAAPTSQRHLYFHKYLRSELVFQRALEQRWREPPLEGDWASILDDVLVREPLRFGNTPVTLDADQRLALAAALTSNQVIISGGPGTGKTSLVLTLLRCLLRRGLKQEQLALAAPTGRAAQRLGDALRQGIASLPEQAVEQTLRDVKPTTLHQLLKFSPVFGTFARHEENPIEADVVIVDEVSMVGIVLIAQLLKALKPGAKLLLLGDKDQLPSVDAGAVLSCLVPDTARNQFSPALCERLRRLFPDQRIDEAIDPDARNDRVVLLRTNHRSQQHIREVAGRVNAQDAAVVDSMPRLDPADVQNATFPAEPGCWLLPLQTTHASEMRMLAQRWADDHVLPSFKELVRRTTWREDSEADQQLLEQLFVQMESSRVLTVLREGPWGCVSINRYVEEGLRHQLDRNSAGLLFAGAPVLITMNDHARQLYNGDVGLALWGSGGLRVFFRRPGQCVSYAAESLPAHELGYAITVHKSQGSEYGRVLLVLPPTGGRRLLTKEILYTGITRAREQAVVCSTPEVLRQAIQNKIIRESGLF